MEHNNNLNYDNYQLELLIHNSELTNIEIESFIEQKLIVKDRYKFVYLTFLLHGMSILFPWNIFVTSSGYFTKHKFINDPDIMEVLKSMY